MIAVARDEAFHFCYPENLALLEESGAKLAFFSPLRDAALPAGTTGVLLSGGFPEVYADMLSKNAALHRALRQAHAEGLPIYAECGGLMLLTEAIVDFEGRAFPMAGLLGGYSEMTRQLALGYRQARAWMIHGYSGKTKACAGMSFITRCGAIGPTSCRPLMRSCRCRAGAKRARGRQHPQPVGVVRPLAFLGKAGVGEPLREGLHSDRN